MFSLSKAQIDKIERLQKIALYIILGKDAAKHYNENMIKVNCESLEDRRDKISENCAKNFLKHPEHRKMFQFNLKSKTRSGKRVVIPQSRTERYSRSTIPSLGNIINKKLTKYI